MASWKFHVVDGVSGKAIQGAAISANVSTSCCPNCTWGSCSCGSCTSGPGSNFIGNTDSGGNFNQNVAYTCVQTLNYNVSAVGYSSTNDVYTSGYITGDVGIPTISLTPIGNVPQSNQGPQGTTSAATTTTTLGLTSFFGSTTGIIVLIGLILLGALWVVF
jgi:hypothetical protein